MTKILTCLMALVMLFIGACFSDAELIVKNNSTGDAWVRIDSGYERFIPAMSRRTIGVSGTHTVALHYRGDHILRGVIYVDMSYGGGQNLTLEPNCGALRIRNSSNRSIRGAYLTRSGSNQWGGNILDGHLQSGTSETISLNPDLWDLKIEDQHYNFYYYSGLSVSLDQTRLLSFNP